MTLYIMQQGHLLCILRSRNTYNNYYIYYHAIIDINLHLQLHNYFALLFHYFTINPLGASLNNLIKSTHAALVTRILESAVCQLRSLETVKALFCSQINTKKMRKCAFCC